jgi:hypothetical protein
MLVDVKRDDTTPDKNDYRRPYQAVDDITNKATPRASKGPKIHLRPTFLALYEGHVPDLQYRQSCRLLT